jgi:hypothetical protein
MRPIESADCKTLFYVSDLGNEILQVPVTGGLESHVVAPVCPEFGFALGAEGLYYPAPVNSGNGCDFRFFSLATGQSRPIVRTPARPLGRAASVSPDGRYVLFEQSDRPGMDLMLVKDFKTH